MACEWRPLNVLLASMAPFVGGAEVAAQRLAEGLVEEGHEVRVLVGTRGEVLERMMRAGLRCEYTPMYLTDKWRWLRYGRARHRMRSILRRHRPDIIHSNDLPTHQIVSDAARGLGIPRICHHRFPFEGPAIDWLAKYGAERHLFVSRALMDEMCRASEQLARSSMSIVHDGLVLPPLPSEKDRALARSRIGLRAERISVLFAGQVVEIKGIEELLEAWMKIDPDIRSRADLLIVGEDFQREGAYRLAMQDRAVQLGCPARFCGYRDDVGDWQLAADIAVVPSREEPLGLVVMEAMARGKPVVGTNVGGIPEMIDHETTGLLVPPRSPDDLALALTRLICDESLRSAFGEAGRRRCEERFSLKSHVHSILREYARVLDSGDRMPID